MRSQGVIRHLVLFDVPVLNRDSTANAHWWGRGNRSRTLGRTSTCAAIAAAYISQAFCVECQQTCMPVLDKQPDIHKVHTAAVLGVKLLPGHHWTKTVGHVGTALL